MGIDSAVRAISAPIATKKVAVVGGDPEGLKVAVTAAELAMGFKNPSAAHSLRLHRSDTPLELPMRFNATDVTGAAPYLYL